MAELETESQEASTGTDDGENARELPRDVPQPEITPSRTARPFLRC